MRSFVSQTLHIFRKDARGLWKQIAWALGATLLFALWGILSANFARGQQLVSYRPVLAAFLLLTWCVLAGMLVSAEPLVGDRPFWRTLPYAWPSLLAAKLLGIVTWILLPKLVADVVVLVAHGFFVPERLPGLLLSTLTVFLCLVPAIFAAAVSPRPMVWATAVFVGIPALAVWNRFFVSMLDDGEATQQLWSAAAIGLLCLSLCLLALLVWQYAQRRTAWVVALGLGALIACPLAASRVMSWTAQFELQSLLAPSPVAPGSLRVALGSNSSAIEFLVPELNGGREIGLPIRLAGLPPDMTPVFQGATFSLRTAAGEIAVGDSRPWQNVKFDSGAADRESASLRFALTARDWQRVYMQPFAIHGVAYVALYGKTRSTRIQGFARWTTLGTDARCAMFPSVPGRNLPSVLHCERPFRWRPGEFVSTITLPSFVPSAPGASSPFRRAEASTEMLLESSTPLDGLPSFGNPGPFTDFSRFRLSETDKQPLIKYRELLGYAKVPFDLPDILYATPGDAPRQKPTGPVAQSDSGGSFARRVFATVEVTLPPSLRGGTAWQVVLVRDDQPGSVHMFDGPQPGGPIGDSRQQIFAYAPGVYHLVVAPADTNFHMMSSAELASAVRKGQRLVITERGHINVELREPGRRETK